MAAFTAYAQGGLVLIVLITAAAFAYLSSFNFAIHRFQSIYLGVYLIALVIVVYYLWRQRRSIVRSTPSTSTQ